MANINLTDPRKRNAVVKAENVGIPFEGSETKPFEHAFLFQQFLRGWLDRCIHGVVVA